MKRSGPLRRGKPPKRGKPLERKTAMPRSGPIKRKPKPRRDPAIKALEDEMKAIFVAGIRRERCASCGAAAPAVVVRAHHVLRRKILERALRARGWSEEAVIRAAWDPRNRLPIDDFCHGDHHNGMRRLSLSLIVRAAPGAILFAKELDLLDDLKRDYTD